MRARFTPVTSLQGLRLLMLIAGLLGATGQTSAQTQITVPRAKGGFNFTAFDGPAPERAGVVMIPTYTFVGIGGEERLNVDWLAINVRWGILFGEVVEDYAVEWMNYPNVPFIAFADGDHGGGRQMAYRLPDFAPYPDLLFRINQLRPTAIEFSITFSVTDAGGRLHRGYTKIPAVMTLFARSGERPFNVPSIRQTGKFLDESSKREYPDVLKVLAGARSLTIERVTITRLDWPVHEMRAILAKLAEYKKEPDDEKMAAKVKEELDKAKKQAAAQAATDEKKHAELETLRASQEKQLEAQAEARPPEPPEKPAQVAAPQLEPKTPKAVVREVKPATATNPLAEATYTIPGLGLEMVRIEPGTFQMGSTSPDAHANERPVTTVRITKPFLMGKHEVTQAQWQEILGWNNSRFKGDNRPVQNVSWENVMNFCRALSERERAAGRLPADLIYTLPTEAQWEYACRAGTTSDHVGNLDAVAWYKKNSLEQTHPVGSKQPNEWGLHDMFGNVEEWCADVYLFNAHPGGTVVDPLNSAKGSGRVARGGSYISGTYLGRPSTRGPSSADTLHYSSTDYLGLRIVLTSVQ